MNRVFATRPFDTSSGTTRNRSGLSLMEVMVAVAILGAAMGVISNLMFIGSSAATNARQVSEGQILCDTKMAELSAGILPLQKY